MDANRKKIIVVGGAAIAALVLILFVVLFFLGGEPEPKPVAVKPIPPKAEAEKPAEAQEAAKPATPPKAEKASSYSVNKGALLEDIAARPDVFGDAGKWWTLWQANPDAVTYAFQKDGEWVAVVRPGKTLSIPEARNLSDAEKAALTAKITPYAVQFASFPNAAEANKLRADLASANPGMDFYVTPRSLDGVFYHRVRAGLFKSWNEAEKFGASLESSGKVDDYYTTEPQPEEIRTQNAVIYQKYKGGE